MSLGEPLPIAEKQGVAPNCGRIAAGVIPGGPATGGRKVPLAVVIDHVVCVLDAFARGLQESADFHRARLKVFAAAPILTVDRRAVERPQITARVVFSEDEDIG